jgi:hypothetical protein
MDIGFLITSYNRQEPCQRLVDSLKGIGDIIVVHDGTGYEIQGATNHYIRIHLGKPHYWALVNKLFSLRGKHKYFIMLPDDFMMDAEGVKEAVRQWEAITDKKKICLSLWQPRTVPCWTGVKPREAGEVLLSQWMDMCFICEETFFSMVGTIPPIKYDWERRPNTSSGVGAYISRRLFGLRLNMYQVKEALVSMQEGLPSEMQNKDNYDNSRYSINPRQGRFFDNSRNVR